MIIPILCVTIFVILVVWFLLQRVARLMIHTPTAISIFVCLSMVQLMRVFISMRCNLCGLFFFSSRRRHTRLQGDWSSDVCSSDLAVFGGYCEGAKGAALLPRTTTEEGQGHFFDVRSLWLGLQGAKAVPTRK